MCQMGTFRGMVRVEPDEPIEAWRVMRRDKRGRIRSMYKSSFTWGGRTTITKRTHTSLVLPHRHNKTGLWAYFERRAAVKAYSEHNLILARVRAWGRVAIHARGVRAECMRVDHWSIINPPPVSAP